LFVKTKKKCKAVKDILGNLFRLNSKRPPVSVHTQFKTFYPAAINEDWSREEDLWEVVFHDGEVEKIARFSNSGNLEELRVNRSVRDLPVEIYNHVNQLGEIMNVIFIQKGDQVNWEIIYRDSELNRFLILVGNEGNRLNWKPL